jgi:ABC-type nitrate/sulfonate/bicarbonate transport system substrate-binding protein
MVTQKTAATIVFSILTTLGFVYEADARRVLVGVPGYNAATIAFPMAKDIGYYREEDLDVEFVWMAAGLITPAVLGGSIDFGQVGGAVMPALVRGAPLRILFTTSYRPQFWLYAKSDITSVKGLRAKRVAVSSIGSGPDFLLREVLKRQGLEGGRDVAILGIGVSPTRLTALLSGTVDASILSPPQTFMAEESGFRELIAFPKEDLIELQGSLEVRDELLQSDPGLVEKFIRATMKGLLHAREKPVDTVPVLMRYMKVKENYAAKSYEATRPALTVYGSMTEELQKKAIQQVADRLGLNEAPALEKIFSFTLTNKIYSELKAKGWKAK